MSACFSLCLFFLFSFLLCLFFFSVTSPFPGACDPRLSLSVITSAITRLVNQAHSQKQTFIDLIHKRSLTGGTRGTRPGCSASPK